MKAELNLRTIVSPQPLQQPIAHQDKVLSLGSCFAETMGARMRRAGIQTLTNPLGITFNPISLAKAVDRICKGTKVEETALVSLQDLWHHWDFHTHFSATSKAEAVLQMNEAITAAHQFIHSTQHVIITLGTAWVHSLKEQNQVVNNCHKFPSNQFEKSLLSVSEVRASLAAMIEQLRGIRSDMRILFTLSPVRHWKDGAEENTLSKATLRLAIQELCQQMEQLSYFPAYEIMMDELRDYRFYADDMLHPSILAQDIIWARFKNTAFDASNLETIRRVEEVQDRRAHRSLFPDSDSDRAFKAKLTEDIQGLQADFDYLQFT